MLHSTGYCLLHCQRREKYTAKIFFFQVRDTKAYCMHGSFLNASQKDAKKYKITSYPNLDLYNNIIYYICIYYVLMGSGLTFMLQQQPFDLFWNFNVSYPLKENNQFIFCFDYTIRKKHKDFLCLLL